MWNAFVYGFGLLFCAAAFACNSACNRWTVGLSHPKNHQLSHPCRLLQLKPHSSMKSFQLTWAHVPHYYLKMNHLTFCTLILDTWIKWPSIKDLFLDQHHPGLPQEHNKIHTTITEEWVHLWIDSKTDRWILEGGRDVLSKFKTYVKFQL